MGLDIEGSSSPDGPEKANARLARKRAGSFRDYLLRTTSVSDSLISLTVKSENWEGLASLYPYAAEIIKRYAGPAKREAALKAYKGGRDWPMLRRDILPKLRYVSARARYIEGSAGLRLDSVTAEKSIEYTSSEAEGAAITGEYKEPEAAQADDTVDADADDAPRHFYIKTNAPAWALLISNVAAEIDLRPHWSVTLPIYYSGVNYFKSTVKFRTFGVWPEVRYWFDGGNDGWFVGAHLGMAYYNVATNGTYRIQDRKGHTPAYGGGFAAGYRLPISRDHKWKMEFSLGAGVYSLHYDRFRNRPNGLLVDTKRKTYWGIDQASVSFAYTFDLKKKGGPK